MRDNLWIGVAAGLICPIIAYFLTVCTPVPERFFPEKPFMLYLVAGGVNLLMIRALYRKTVAQEKTAKGVMLITFIGMLVFLYFHNLNM